MFCTPNWPDMSWPCRFCNAAELGTLAGEKMPAAVIKSLSCEKFRESGMPTNICRILSSCCQLEYWPELFNNRCKGRIVDSSRSELSLVDPVNRRSTIEHHSILRK